MGGRAGEMSIKRTAKADSGARSARAGGFASWAAGLGLAVGLVNLVLLLALVAGRAPSDEAGRIPDLAGASTPDAGAVAAPVRQAPVQAARQPDERAGAAQAAAGGSDRPDDDVEAQPVVDVPPARPTESARPQAAPEEARVGLRLQVLNGAGVARLASRTADALLRLRYDVRETGNTRERAERSRILVRRGGLPLGLRLAEDLDLAADRVLLEPDGRLVDVDLTLVIGADWKELRPYR